MSRTTGKKRAAFSLALTLIVLLLAEIVLRVAGFSYDPSASYMTFNFPSPNELYQVFEPDPKLLWRMRAGFEFGQGFPPLNSQGFRDKEFIKQKQEGVIRVACIGDSVTFGRPDADYPGMLEEMFEGQDNFKLETMNLGVPGYSSLQGRRLLAWVLENYKPDLVIISFGWNDHWLAMGFPDKDQVVGPAKPEEKKSPLSFFRLYQLLHELADTLRAPAAPQGPPKLRVSPEDYRSNLEAMVRMSRESGARVMLLTAPSAIPAGVVPDYLTYLGFITKDEDLAALHDEYNQVVADVAAQEGVAVCDLDGVFKQSKDIDELFTDPSKDLIHPNRKGYELFTGVVLICLDENELLP